jgi:hypothetical protein
MKKVVLFIATSFFLVHFTMAQNVAEEEFVKKVYEALQKGNKKEILEKLALQVGDYEVYTEGQKALGGKTMTKEEFTKVIEDKTFRISRNYDELLRNASLNKVKMSESVFASYKKVSDANTEHPAGLYKIFCQLYGTYKIRMNIELCPFGNSFKLFYLEERMNVTM